MIAMPLDRRTVLGGALLAPSLLAGACSDPGPELVVYTTTPKTLTAELARQFEARTGVRVMFWRADRHEMMKRAELELSRGAAGFDLVEMESSFIWRLRGRKVLRAFPASIKTFPGAPELASSRVRSSCLMWNTGRIAPDLVPGSYEDLLRPEFKGRIVMVGGAMVWFYAMHKVWGQAKAKAYFDALAKQQLRVSEGHSLTAELIASGEFTICPTIFEYKAASMKKAGDPVDFKLLSPVSIEQSAWGLRAGSSKQRLAEQFVNFAQTAGRQLLIDQSMVPGSIPEFLEAYPAAVANHVSSEELSDPALLADWNRRNRKFMQLAGSAANKA